MITFYRLTVNQVRDPGLFEVVRCRIQYPPEGRCLHGKWDQQKDLITFQEKAGQRVPEEVSSHLCSVFWKDVAFTPRGWDGTNRVLSYWYNLVWVPKKSKTRFKSCSFTFEVISEDLRFILIKTALIWGGVGMWNVVVWQAPEQVPISSGRTSEGLCWLTVRLLLECKQTTWKPSRAKKSFINRTYRVMLL